MNILITGVHGFVGSNLVAALKEEHTIYGLDIVSPEKEGVVRTFDWNEFEKLPSFDAIIHLAGKAHDTKNITSEQDYFDVNIGLTRKIAEYFVQTGAHKFIFFSSVKAAADSVKGDLLTEKEEPAPGKAYGRSKLEAERFLNTLRMKGPKKIIILRPCMIHGPGNKGNLNLLNKVVSKGIPWPLGSYENRRSFISIANLNFVIDQLLEKDIEPGVYNVADDEPLSTNQIIKLMAESRKKNARIWRINPELVSFVARIGDKLHLPLNNERLKKLTESYVVSNAKLKNAIGIQNMPVSAVDGMKITLESFRILD